MLRKLRKQNIAFTKQYCREFNRIAICDIKTERELSHGMLMRQLLRVDVDLIIEAITIDTILTLEIPNEASGKLLKVRC